MNQEKKKCFVICPIGSKSSPQRENTDKLIKYIVEPACDSNYVIEAAHQISESGTITNQIIDRLYRADLVIADLTELNPNVLYELGVRHAFLKPCIQLIKYGHALPFDLYQVRTIHYNFDVQECQNAVSELKEQIVFSEKENHTVKNPISDVIDADSFKRKNTTLDQAMGDLIEKVSSVDSKIYNIDFFVKEVLKEVFKLTYYNQKNEKRILMANLLRKSGEDNKDNHFLGSLLKDFPSNDSEN